MRMNANTDQTSIAGLGSSRSTRGCTKTSDLHSSAVYRLDPSVRWRKVRGTKVRWMIHRRIVHSRPPLKIRTNQRWRLEIATSWQFVELATSDNRCLPFVPSCLGTFVFRRAGILLRALRALRGLRVLRVFARTAPLTPAGAVPPSASSGRASSSSSDRGCGSEAGSCRAW